MIDAILRWTRETTGLHFENYVALRAHGAMLDGLRAIDPGTGKVRKDMRRVEAAISALPEQKQSVLKLYYGDALKMHEVGRALGISEARVSQLHTHTIAQLRADILGDDGGATLLKPRSKPRSVSL